MHKEGDGDMSRGINQPGFPGVGKWRQGRRHRAARAANSTDTNVAIIENVFKLLSFYKIKIKRFQSPTHKLLVS